MSGPGSSLHFFELHVEFEGFFEEVGWGYLFFFGAAGFGGVGGCAGLLFELNAFEGEQVFGSGDGVAEGAVGVVERGTGGESGFLGVGAEVREAVWVELAGLRIEGLLERVEVDVQVRGEAKLSEVIVLCVVAHQHQGYRERRRWRERLIRSLRSVER